MLKRSIAAILLTCLISLSALADIPTAEQIDSVYENTPQLIHGMVQKLYVLEHADPVISVPSLGVFVTEDEVRVQWAGDMTIVIGSKENELSYVVNLDVAKVTLAETPDIGVPWWIYPTIGVVSFASGFLVAVLASR